jgi:hypothetical protein
MNGRALGAAVNRFMGLGRISRPSVALAFSTSNKVPSRATKRSRMTDRSILYTMPAGAAVRGAAAANTGLTHGPLRQTPEFELNIVNHG